MGRPNRFQIMETNSEEIEMILSSEEDAIFTYTDLSLVLNENRDAWRLPKATTISDFIKFLVERETLTELKLNFPYKTICRYTFSDVSLYKIMSSLIKGSYLSHHTAALYHGLTVSEIENFYINKEQSDKEWSNTNSPLIQESINKAFSRKMRQSQNFALYKNLKVTILNGKQTGDLEVCEENKIRVTSIERTLIDIVVRPDYAGGPAEILNIYKNAKLLVSVQKLINVLEQLDYKYPYHQSIGFYMEKAQYREEDIVLIDNLPKEVDFYLTYKMSSPKYSNKWKVFYPDIF